MIINLFQAENSLPPEPNAGSPDVTTFRFRTPTGEFIIRRFTVDTKLKVNGTISSKADLTRCFLITGFAYLHHCHRIPARWVQSYHKLSQNRCTFIPMPQPWLIDLIFPLFVAHIARSRSHAAIAEAFPSRNGHAWRTLISRWLAFMSHFGIIIFGMDANQM